MAAKPQYYYWKAAVSSFIFTMFRGDFASKPMTLPEIDHIITQLFVQTNFDLFPNSQRGRLNIGITMHPSLRFSFSRLKIFSFNYSLSLIIWSPHLSCINVIKLKWEIVWTGELPHLSGLPHLPGASHLHVNRILVSSLRCIYLRLSVLL